VDGPDRRGGLRLQFRARTEGGRNSISTVPDTFSERGTSVARGAVENRCFPFCGVGRMVIVESFKAIHLKRSVCESILEPAGFDTS